MTISTTDDPRAGPYNGNDSQTAFPFSFKVFEEEDLRVVHTDADGIDTDLTLDSDFSVSLNADQNSNPGGTVTYPMSGDPLPDGETLTITSDLDYTQETDIQNAGGFYPEVIENALDRVTMLIKQVHTKVVRTLQLSVTTPDGVDATLPAPVSASVVGWNADGTALRNYLLSDGITVVGVNPDDLASAASATKGAGMTGFGYALDYVANSIGWAVQQGGVRLEWFYESGDGEDYLAAIGRAIAFLTNLSGPGYADSMGQSPYGYGVSRALNLAGKKYPLSNTITLSADIGIFASGGGFYATSAFPAAAYMIDTGADPYGGRVIDLTLDGSDRNVKGVRIQNAHHTRWRGLSVVSCRNDGIVYEGGAEFVLDGFEVAGAATPTALTVAGLRVLGSDAVFANGVVKYTPLGVYASGGGNCEFAHIHTWGLYAAFKQYVGFWSVNAVRNTYTACFADSPTKQDYAQDNLVVLNGIPNGGIGFYLDATSAQNVLLGCRGYINTTAYAAAGLPGTNQFDAVYIAGEFNNVFGLIYNYAGNWANDVRFASNAVRDTCLRVGTPGTPNGFTPASLALVNDSDGGATQLTVQNTDNGFASSSANLTLQVGSGTATAEVAGVYGTAGASYMLGKVLGAEKFRYTATKSTFSQDNASEGDQSIVFNDGIGSFPMMALYRNNGGGAPNAAFAAAKFGDISSNSRSINAAGTINASGADYAEYMTKAPGCGIVAKGQIVGVDAQGELTDRWADAVSFVVKSTDPSYIGNDKWAQTLGPRPVEPQWSPPPLPEQPPNAAPADVVAAWKAEIGTILAPAEAAHAAAVAEYQAALAAFEPALEAARQTVDRIAFCGQVPVNVLGAAAGDYIVPVQDGDSIAGMAVSAPTFDQYRAAVGRVVAIEADGRARIVVKVS